MSKSASSKKPSSLPFWYVRMCVIGNCTSSYVGQSRRASRRTRRKRQRMILAPPFFLLSSRRLPTCTTQSQMERWNGSGSTSWPRTWASWHWVELGLPKSFGTGIWYLINTLKANSRRIKEHKRDWDSVIFFFFHFSMPRMRIRKKPIHILYNFYLNQFLIEELQPMSPFWRLKKRLNIAFRGSLFRHTPTATLYLHF